MLTSNHPPTVDPVKAFIQNLEQQMGAESQLQSLPPAVQKAIYLHLTQGNEPQRAEAQGTNNTNRGKCTEKLLHSPDEE